MSYEEVREQFDLPRLQAFTSYSTKNPPVHMMIASYFGVYEKAEQASPKSQDAALSALIAQLPQTEP